jgi:hypothetical protein
MMQDDPAIEVVMLHLNIDEDAAHVWVDYIAKLTFGNDPSIYDLKRDIENLENLERSLNAVIMVLDISSMTQAAQDALGLRMIWGPFAEELIARSGQESETFSDEFHAYPDKVGQKASGALHALEDNITAIRDAIKSTKRHIEQSSQSRVGTGRINFKGIQLVNSARDVWRLSTGKEAPSKALNPEAKFGKFLSDLFDAFEIGGDPRAAFRAWAAMQ